MGNLYSGIKRIDEAQRLLMKEYEENGLQFVLITRPCETKHGIVFVGDPTELAAVWALQSTENNSVAEFIDGAFRGMRFVQSKEWQDEHKQNPDESHQ